MVKILIYEDSPNDLISRYARLTANHEVHIRHSPVSNFGLDSLRWEPDQFIVHGFDPNNFKNGYGNPAEESAEVYFLDGLRGYCFDLLEDLPRNRSFINSDSIAIVREAKRRQVNIVGLESVDEIIERIGGDS